MEKYTNDRFNAAEGPFQKTSRATHLQFLFPRLGLVLFVGAITAMMAIQPIYKMTEAQIPKKASGKAKVTLADNQGTLQATLNSLTISGAPSNAHLIIHIHAPNTDPANPGLCKGPILFIIQDPQLQVKGNGKFSTGTLQFTENNDLKPDQKSLLNAKDFNTWLVNVHNADNIDPADNKPVSIVCGPIKAAANATSGTAILKPSPKPKPAPPTA